MNKYQEAKDYYFKIYDENHLGMLARHYIDILQEAAEKAEKYDEKETPKKPARKSGNWGICPKCNEKIFFGRAYCPHCGQALDWSSYYD